MVKYLITSYFKLHGHPLDDISVILMYVSVRIKKKQEGIKKKNQVTSSAKPAREVLHEEQTLNRRKLFFLKSEHMLL